MEGTHLRLYTCENRKLHGRLGHEWRLEQARGLGIAGGSAYRAIAGYGRAGDLHEMHFYGLAGEQPVLVEFFAPSAAIVRLLAATTDAGSRSGSGTRPASDSFPEPDAAGQVPSPRACARASRRASSFSFSRASMPRVVGS